MPHPVWRAATACPSASRATGDGVCNEAVFWKDQDTSVVLFPSVPSRTNAISVSCCAHHHYPVGSREPPGILGPGLTPDNSYFYSFRAGERR